MVDRHARAFLFAVGLLARPLVAFAQGGLPTLPPAAQIPGLIQNATSSELSQIQQQIQASGMTPDQIRQALQARGIPANSLDALLPGTKPDSTALTDNTFTALRALGIMDSASVDSLRGKGDNRTRDRARADSVFLADTLARVLKNDSTAAALRLFLRSTDATRALVDSGFGRFGADLFSGPRTQFDPIQNGPVDETYRLQPGDRLVLRLTGDVTDASPLTVLPDGALYVKNISRPLQVATLTLAQLRTLLGQELAKVYSGVKPGDVGTTHFDVEVATLEPKRVHVDGYVKAPDSYEINGLGTVLTALDVAGGPNADGDMRAVQVLRGDKTIATIDLYDYLLTGKSSGDIRLQTGDHVFVPPSEGTVRIAGAVLRPMTYQIKTGESLGDVLEMAGGLSPDANTRWVQIDRILPAAQRAAAPGGDRTTIYIRSPDVSRAADVIQPGDIVRIYRVDPHIANRVTVIGDVWSSGVPIAFIPGMRLSQALTQAGGVKPDVYRNEIQILRLSADSTRRIIPIRLVDSVGTPADDILLQDGDEIHVASQTQFRTSRWVEIDGAVRKPGRYPYHDGMTDRDLAMLANGLQDGALLTDAEIFRMPADRSNGALAQAIHVQLDSNFLFERGANGRFGGPPGLPGPASSPDVPLMAYDKVLINRQPDFSLPRTVTITGEVKFPGPYALLTKNERLSDLIARAGGLTPSAYPAGIVFIRKTAAPEGGRIGVDLPAVLRDPNNIDNLFLVDSDSISIPVYSGIVAVRGAVNSPVAVAYVPGQNLDYYIRAAGGGNAQSATEHAYVTQPDGKVESRTPTFLHLRTITPVPRPGATVTVPLKDLNAAHDWAAILAGTASILGSVVAIVAILKP